MKQLRQLPMANIEDINRLLKSDILETEVYPVLNTLKKKRIISNIIRNSLTLFQWSYQNASSYASKRDAVNANTAALDLVSKMLIQAGDYSLNEKVHDVVDVELYVTKQDIITNAKKFIKEECLKNEFTESFYNKNLGKLLGQAFTEICDDNPISEPPAHFDSDWEPPL